MYLKSIRNIIVLMTVFSIFSCGSNAELDTVDELDLEKYSGTWYEIARLPNNFEKNLICVTANYSIKDNSKVQVINKGHREDNPSKLKESKGTAWVPDSDEPGRLKVSFFWPFAGDYYVMQLDPDYKYSLVGSPTRKYLWILCRNKRLDGPTINKLMEYAAEQGFDVEQLEWIDQSCM